MNIDEIFIKGKEKEKKQVKNKKINKKINKAKIENKKKKNKKKNERKTSDGYKIIKEEDLLIQNKNGGKSDLCPFDCKCCY